MLEKSKPKMENRINEKQYPESKNRVEKSRRALKPQSEGLFADRAPFILACKQLHFKVELEKNVAIMQIFPMTFL